MHLEHSVKLSTTTLGVLGWHCTDNLTFPSPKHTFQCSTVSVSNIPLVHTFSRMFQGQAWDSLTPCAMTILPLISGFRQPQVAISAETLISNSELVTLNLTYFHNDLHRSPVCSNTCSFSLHSMADKSHHSDKVLYHRDSLHEITQDSFQSDVTGNLDIICTHPYKEAAYTDRILFLFPDRFVH